MSERRTPCLVDYLPPNSRNPHAKVPASKPGGAKSGAHADEGGFPTTPIVVAHPCAVQGPEKPVTQKNVKNEDRSSEFIENNEAKKVLLRVC